MLGTSEISLLLLVVIGGITVYYILTDGMSKSNNEKKSEQPKEVDNGQVESIQQEPEVKEVQTKQTATNTNVTDETMKQTEEYNPTVSAPLPKMPKAVTNVQQQEASMIPGSNEQNAQSELTMEDLKGNGELIKVTCQWCDYVVEMRKGETMVCPRCSGTIES